eukprot:GEMP01005899.1.p1 GENE.GEMP01005899.1~~GEMP01005899.1.p1  ORF type:complete len:448 (+),score=75.07 GEMP01005899.1:163-1506(+)
MMDDVIDTIETTWSIQCWPKPKKKRTEKECANEGFFRRTNWTEPHVSRTLAWLIHDDRRGNTMRAPLPADVLQSVLAPFLHFDAPISDMIYVCGGRNQTIGPLPTAEMFDSWHGKWRQLNNMLTSRAGCAAASLKDRRVMVVGGYDGNGIVKGLLRSTEIYDPQTGEWELAGDLCRARWGHGCAALGGYVFAVGGCSLLREAPMQEQFMETLRVCEAYDVTTNRWSEIASLHTCRAGSRLVAVANRYIVAVGGCDDVFGRAEMLNTCEVFDAETNRWEILDARLSIPRTTAAVAAISDWHVLVIGGAPNLKSTEVISVRTPEKTDCAAQTSFQGMGRLGCHMGHLSQGRMGCQAVCVTLPQDCASFPGTLQGQGYHGRRMVVVLGGEDGEEEADPLPNEWSHGKQFNTLELFDIEARKWREVRLPEMRTPRTAMAACVSYGIVGGYC